MILRTKFQNFPGGNTPGFPDMGRVTVECIHVWGYSPHWHFSDYGPNAIALRKLTRLIFKRLTLL